jgi:hypothetical protein
VTVKLGREAEVYGPTHALDIAKIFARYLIFRWYALA